VQGSRVESYASAKTEEERALRLGVQEQRNVRVPIFRIGYTGASHLKAIVHTQTAVRQRIFDDRCGRHYPFTKF
jgi:hypothetical protein